jgi:hypothetical protein
VPEFAGETSSATETREPTPLAKMEELVEAPAIEKIKEPGTEEVKISAEEVKISEIEVAKSQKGPIVTPKRKRMVNVLDVLETIKSSSITSKKTAETSEVPTEAFVAEASKQQFRIETSLQSPPRWNPWKPKKQK